ncbi:hypothetical protein FQZ97_680250 [compost metagenome]
MHRRRQIEQGRPTRREVVLHGPGGRQGADIRQTQVERRRLQGRLPLRVDGPVQHHAARRSQVVTFGPCGRVHGRAVATQDDLGRGHVGAGEVRGQRDRADGLAHPGSRAHGGQRARGTDRAYPARLSARPVNVRRHRDQAVGVIEHHAAHAILHRVGRGAHPNGIANTLGGHCRRPRGVAAKGVIAAAIRTRNGGAHLDLKQAQRHRIGRAGASRP